MTKFNAPPQADTEEFNPHEQMTRGEFVNETLRIWEEQEARMLLFISRVGDPERRSLMKRRHQEFGVAITVLKNTYFAEELTDFVALEEQMKEVTNGETEASS